jgi:hypothetical protein
MTASTLSDDADAAASAARDQLPDAFVQSLTANGGLGIAAELYTSLREGLDK